MKHFYNMASRVCYRSPHELIVKHSRPLRQRDDISVPLPRQPSALLGPHFRTRDEITQSGTRTTICFMQQQTRVFNFKRQNGNLKNPE